MIIAKINDSLCVMELRLHSCQLILILLPEIMIKEINKVDFLWYCKVYINSLKLIGGIGLRWSS